MPSTRFNVGPGEVILLALVPKPYVPEPEFTEPAYKVIEVPEVCALVMVAVKVDTKPVTSIRVNTKKIRFFIIIIFNNLSLIVLKRFSVVEKTATAIDHLARCT